MCNMVLSETGGLGSMMQQAKLGGRNINIEMNLNMTNPLEKPKGDKADGPTMKT